MKHLTAAAVAMFGAMTLAQAEPGSPLDQPADSPGADATLVADTDTSPYHVALINYKSGHYDKARAAIDEAEKAKPGNLAVEVLKARILTEQHDYAGGEKLLHSLLNPDKPENALTGNALFEVQLALADLLLRRHSFDRATTYYKLALQAKPKDPDLMLKLIYARVGANDLVGAEQFSSHLQPLDPKNPYDDHASYYFAKAAIAQATGNSAQADDDIQTARTIYGITIANHYLKLYLEIFESSNKGGNPDMTPPPLVKPAPTGAKS